jgi:hypothetical protein
LGGVVSAEDGDVGGVEVDAVGLDVGPADGLGHDGGGEAVSNVEEGVEGSAEPIVVEFVIGNAEEEFGVGVGGPGGDVHEGAGFVESCSEEGGENLSVGEFLLGPVGCELVDGVGDAEFIEEWS